jgi:hypothetical protein
MIKKIVFDWRIKLLLEKIVSFFPFGLDYKLYSYFGHKFIDVAVPSTDERIEKGIKNLELIKEQTKIEYQKKHVLELGTGLQGVDILLFYILGCSKIITLDHIMHLRKDLMTLAVDSLKKRLGDISKRFNQNVIALKERIGRIKTDGSLNDLLSSCKIFAYNGVVPKLENIGNKSVDIFYSESCLQRIPMQNLNKIFEVLPLILSENAISFHRIDSNDFNSMYFKNLWRLNYLKYSDFIWSIMTAEKFNSQNRLRENQFISLLESAGLNTLYVESGRREKDIEKLENFPLAKRFQGIELEEIAIAHSKVISTKAPVKKVIRKLDA